MIRARHRAERGFTLIEIALVVLIVGIMAVPLYLLIARELENLHVRQTRDALGLAREALVTYASENNGCLPFAADFEGARIDTDATAAAAAGYADTGKGVANQHAGDLPWADLGLGANFLDGNGMRIQYFVASPYTDSDADPASGITCNAGFRGQEWEPTVLYFATDATPIYLYYTDEGTRKLCKATEPWGRGTPPTLDYHHWEKKHGGKHHGHSKSHKHHHHFADGCTPENHDSDAEGCDEAHYEDGHDHDVEHHQDVDDIEKHHKDDKKNKKHHHHKGHHHKGHDHHDIHHDEHIPKADSKHVHANEPHVVCTQNSLPSELLELRRGPDVAAAAPQNDVMSARNVFVLIAAGANRNAALDRRSIRDANHVADGSGTALALNATSVDTARFAAKLETNVSDVTDQGDDELAFMSFTRFRAALGKFGINMEPLCETAC